MKKFTLASLALVAALACGQAYAATTFNASVTNANGELQTTLTWDSDREGCEASGHPSWSGPKPASGTENLPTIALSGTYSLTLTCVSPADDMATLTWTPPTQNTDGSPLTNLAGYRVYWGTAQGTYPNVVRLDNPGLASHIVDELEPGTWFFVVTALNSVGVESMFSNVASKTLTGEASDSESVTLTVNPVPEAITDLAVQ